MEHGGGSYYGGVVIEGEVFKFANEAF